MAKYIAKRIRFQNGERYSVLQAVGGLPVHEVALYLDRYRKKGRAANTIHAVCSCLTLLYRFLDAANINLLARLTEANFLSIPELDRLVSTLQYYVDDLNEDVDSPKKSNVIHIAKIGPRRKKSETERSAVDTATQANRIRYIADYLEFIANYVGATLESGLRQQLKSQADTALTSFREHIPAVTKRAQLDARVGLSIEQQNLLLSVIHPDSPSNPWARQFVLYRNWLIVVLLLATGMRRGELLGLQIGDLSSNSPKLRIYRRADAREDPRTIQPGTKTHDREIELAPAVMRVLWKYINSDRRDIKAARKVPQVFVSDEGKPISYSSIDKLFRVLREACPGLPEDLTSHVMRHTWNERFSEQAEAMNLPEAVEEKARNSQQGWADNSKMAATYTRGHTAKKGREVALKLQEQLDGAIKNKK